jgi:hypothetical protein
MGAVFKTRASLAKREIVERDLLIASSLDEKHFRGMWNDWNNSQCSAV